MFSDFVATTSQTVIHWKLFHPIMGSATYTMILFQDLLYGSAAKSKLQFKFHHAKQGQSDTGEESPPPSPCLLCSY